MALQEPGDLFTRDNADKLLAELNALGRTANRRSTRRELARRTSQHLSDQGQVGRVYYPDQGQPLMIEAGHQHRTGQGSYPSSTFAIRRARLPTIARTRSTVLTDMTPSMATIPGGAHVRRAPGPHYSLPPSPANTKVASPEFNTRRTIVLL